MTRPSSWREASTSTFLRASGSFTLGLRTRATCNTIATIQRGDHALVQGFLAISLLHHAVRLTSVPGAAWQALPASKTLSDAAAGAAL